MTDGIIQEVFNKSANRYCGDDLDEEVLNFLSALQSELIEKIKQKRDSSFISYYENILYKWLIGDNQE